MSDRYTVVVGNVGTAYSGNDPVEARKVFGEYRDISQGRRGRAAGEDVTLFDDGEPELEYVGRQSRMQAIEDLSAYAYEGDIDLKRTAELFDFLQVLMDYGHLPYHPPILEQDTVGLAFELMRKGQTVHLVLMDPEEEYYWLELDLKADPGHIVRRTSKPSLCLEQLLAAYQEAW